jgi:hypothetical protein
MSYFGTSGKNLNADIFLCFSSTIFIVACRAVTRQRPRNRGSAPFGRQQLNYFLRGPCREILSETRVRGMVGWSAVKGIVGSLCQMASS